MKRNAVDSSNIKSIGYDCDTQTLEVEFKNLSIYRYRTVPVLVYARLMNADSHGQYLTLAIKYSFDCYRVDNPDTPEEIEVYIPPKHAATSIPVTVGK